MKFRDRWWLPGMNWWPLWLIFIAVCFFITALSMGCGTSILGTVLVTAAFGLPWNIFIVAFFFTDSFNAVIEFGSFSIGNETCLGPFGIFVFALPLYINAYLITLLVKNFIVLVKKLVTRL